MKTGMPVLFEYNSVEENMELAKELELDFVEWNLNFPYCSEALEKPGYIKEIVEKYKMDITLHFYDEADFGIYTEVAMAYYGLLEKYLKLGMGYIKQLNIHLIEGPVVTISGVKNYMYLKDFDNYTKRLNNMLAKVDELCKKYNCQLVIENSKTVSYMTKTYDFLIDKGYYFTFDIGHDQMCGNILREYEKTHQMSFKEMHIHDSDGKRDHLSLGLGTIDLNYFKGIATKNDVYALLEVKSSDDLRKSVKVWKEL